MSWAQMGAAGVTVLGLAGAVAISALAKADMIDLATFMQVSGYIGSLLATGLGGVLYGKRVPPS